MKKMKSTTNQKVWARFIRTSLPFQSRANPASTFWKVSQRDWGCWSRRLTRSFLWWLRNLLPCLPFLSHRLREETSKEQKAWRWSEAIRTLSRGATPSNPNIFQEPTSLHFKIINMTFLMDCFKISHLGPQLRHLSQLPISTRSLSYCWLKLKESLI